MTKPEQTRIEHCLGLLSKADRDIINDVLNHLTNDFCKDKVPQPSPTVKVLTWRECNCMYGCKCPPNGWYDHEGTLTVLEVSGKKMGPLR